MVRPLLVRQQTEHVQYRLIFAIALPALFPFVLWRRAMRAIVRGMPPDQTLFAEACAASAATAHLALAG